MKTEQSVFKPDEGEQEWRDEKRQGLNQTGRMELPL